MQQSESNCHHATAVRSRHADLLRSLEIGMILPETWPVLHGTSFVITEVLAGSFVSGSVHCFLPHTHKTHSLILHFGGLNLGGLV